MAAETLGPSGEIRPRDPNDFEDREGLTADLLRAQPELTDLTGPGHIVPADRFVDWIEGVLEVPVSIASHRPTAGDKSVRAPTAI